MKTSHINQHDYITVTVTSPEGVRLNLTQARWSAKVTMGGVRPPVDQSENYKVLHSEFKNPNGVFKLFMKGPQKTNPGQWALATKRAGDSAKSMTEFLTLLRAELTACDVKTATA